jgi:tetratricopeptide (TPR) repeat protein
VGPQYVDSYFYHQWALDIIRGNFWGHEVFFLRPLYSYLLAGVYAVFGSHVLPVQLLQTALATASCLLLYLVSCRLFNRRAGIFAAFGYALTGILVYYTGAYLHVEITIFLSLMFLWLLLVAGKRIWLWILSGGCFGLVVICRPEMLVAAPFLLGWLVHRTSYNVQRSPPLTPTLSPQGRGRRNGIVAMMVAALAVIAIVPVRNYVVARDPVLFTAHSGINFYIGNNPEADGTWQPPAELGKGVGFSHETLKRLSTTIDGRDVKASAASAYWARRGLEFITHQPLKYLRLLGRKMLLFLSNYEVPNDYCPETARAMSLPLRLAFINFGLVLALALLGSVWAWPKRGQVMPVYLFIAANLFSALLFCVLSRLRAPAIPFLLMFAGYGVGELVDAFRQRRTARAVIGVAVALAVYVVSGLIPVKRQGYSAQAWTQTGNIYLDQQDYGPAVDAFRRALVAMPTYNYARYSLVLGLAGAGKTADAEAEFLKIERATAGSADRNTILRLAAARIAIANAISTASPAWRPARRLADAWVAVADGKYPVAESLYRASLTQDPNDSESSFLLGLVYNRMDSLAQAYEWLTRAISLDPANDAARSTLRSVESRLQRNSGAQVP